jgi:hypothetical protein
MLLTSGVQGPFTRLGFTFCQRARHSASVRPGILLDISFQFLALLSSTARLSFAS